MKKETIGSRLLLDILKKLADGWTLDADGPDQMSGIMVKGRGEVKKVRAGTIGVLLALNYIHRDPDYLSTWTISKTGLGRLRNKTQK